MRELVFRQEAFNISAPAEREEFRVVHAVKVNRREVCLELFTVGLTEQLELADFLFFQFRNAAERVQAQRGHRQTCLLYGGSIKGNLLRHWQIRQIKIKCPAAGQLNFPRAIVKIIANLLACHAEAVKCDVQPVSGKIARREDHPQDSCGAVGISDGRLGAGNLDIVRHRGVANAPEAPVGHVLRKFIAFRRRDRKGEIEQRSFRVTEAHHRINRNGGIVGGLREIQINGGAGNDLLTVFVDTDRNTAVGHRTGFHQGDGI